MKRLASFLIALFILVFIGRINATPINGYEQIYKYNSGGAYYTAVINSSGELEIAVMNGANQLGIDTYGKIDVVGKDKDNDSRGQNFTENGEIISASIESYKRQEGVAYFVNVDDLDLDSNENKILTYIPDCDGTLGEEIVIEGNVQDACSVSICEAAVNSNDGTALTIYNQDRNVSTTSGIAVYKDSTSSTAGTQLFKAHFNENQKFVTPPIKVAYNKRYHIYFRSYQNNTRANFGLRFWKIVK